MTAVAVRSSYICPGCAAGLERASDGFACDECGAGFPDAAGLPDLRLASDRYLTLAADRAKAERLHSLEPETDLMGLASAYYAMTDDVLDRRRDRFLRHIAGAEARGDALAARLEGRGRVLEVGCGTGGFVSAAVRQEFEVEAVDVASRWLVVARRRLADRSIATPLTAACAERLPWQDGVFDTVVADSLLEHLDDPALALREWARVLKPGGSLVVWSPNRYSVATEPHLGLWGIGFVWRRALPAYLRCRGRSEWPPRTLSAAEARGLARRAGFRDVTVGPPEISESWADSLQEAERRALRAYRSVHSTRLGRRLLGSFGPLWELRGTAP